MSLDLVILGEDGSPKHTVRIGIDSHCALMELARESQLPLFGRLADYYADAVIEASELSAFLQEIDHLLVSVANDPSLRTVLQEAKALCRQAIGEGKAIEALAD